MFETSTTAAIAVVAVLTKTITTGAFPGASITPTLSEFPESMFMLAQHGDVDHAPPNINQLRARQEVRIRINNQLQILKKMQVEQSLLPEQQRNLTQQHILRQNAQAQQRQLLARQQEAQQAQKRIVLQDAQRSDINQTVQRSEQPQVSRVIQRIQQEQNIKEKYPALQSYYRSLARRILRTQKDRLAAPKDPSLP
jgi:hypothetical protein